MKLPKQDKHKKKKLPKDKAHMNWVASQGCMIPSCSEPPCVHHIRILGEPRDDRKTIPLCYFHHQGDEGIHFLGKHVLVQKIMDYCPEMRKSYIKGCAIDKSGRPLLCVDVFPGYDWKILR